MTANDPSHDLSKVVTVYVTSVGAPTYPQCVEHLRNQDSTFVLRTIERVAPMSAAFQRMLDDCKTPYYVQVDEDMLLYPHAIRSLYERISRANSSVAMLACSLYDEHLERCINGVKIFRHGIVRNYPFKDVEGCVPEISCPDVSR